MITKPTLLIDEEKCRANIRMMAEKAKRQGLVFRPHFKTHQSHEVGGWFREAGVTKITVSSLEMASYFAADNWKDITVAFSVNILEIETINELASKITLNMLVESNETILRLNTELQYPVNLFIKLDIGTNRTGIDPSDKEKLTSLIDAINQAANLNFVGFLAHAGHSYKSRGVRDIHSVHASAQQLLKKVKDHYNGVFISYGDTPTSSVVDDFSFIDELRPGNFAFYDLMMVQIGACTPNQIAVTMACPIVAKHPERNEVVIYGGGVHFSKDQMTEDEPLFGKVVSNKDFGWDTLIENATLIKISQEHGIISAPTDWINSVQMGDIVKIFPVHSCMTMDLMRHQNVQII